jgi:hypothetical protein
LVDGGGTAAAVGRGLDRADGDRDVVDAPVCGEFDLIGLAELEGDGVFGDGDPMTTSCARSRAPSLPMAWLTWVRAVAGLRNSSAPISSLLNPRPTSGSTSRSRGVNTASRSSPAIEATRLAVT